MLFEFGKTIKAVLIAWGVPQVDEIQFDIEANDITIGGKAREANGKGAVHQKTARPPSRKKHLKSAS